MSQAAVRTCTATESFLKNLQNSQERTSTKASFQPATFDLIGKETPAYIAFFEFCEIFLGTLSWLKTILQTGFWNGNFTKNGEPIFFL